MFKEQQLCNGKLLNEVIEWSSSGSFRLCLSYNWESTLCFLSAFPQRRQMNNASISWSFNPHPIQQWYSSALFFRIFSWKRISWRIFTRIAMLPRLMWFFSVMWWLRCVVVSNQTEKFSRYRENFVLGQHPGLTVLNEWRAMQPRTVIVCGISCPSKVASSAAVIELLSASGHIGSGLDISTRAEINERVALHWHLDLLLLLLL